MKPNTTTEETPMKRLAPHDSSHPGDGLIDAPPRANEFLQNIKRKEKKKTKVSICKDIQF